MSNQPSPSTSYTDLRTLFISCTLKRSPEPSHTETLMRVSQIIMEKQGVTVETVRAVDYNLAPGVQPDMAERGLHDDWPKVYDKVRAADILIIGTPIWLGERASVCTRVIERLYAQSGQLNEKGQYSSYGKVAAAS